MSVAAELDETDFDDGDSGGGSDVAALDVLVRFSHLVQQRQGVFPVIVMELLQQAVDDVAAGDWS